MFNIIQELLQMKQETKCFQSEKIYSSRDLLDTRKVSGFSVNEYFCTVLFTLKTDDASTTPKKQRWNCFAWFSSFFKISQVLINSEASPMQFKLSLLNLIMTSFAGLENIEPQHAWHPDDKQIHNYTTRQSTLV